MNANISHIANHFGIVFGTATCWNCQQSTPVSAILLDQFQERYEDGDPWEQSTEPALLEFMSHISTEAAAAWQRQAPLVVLAPTQTSRITYYANHCSNCDAVQGDWHLRKPGAAFFPTDPREVDSLTLRWIDTPIQAAASGAQSSWQDRLIEKFPRLRT